MRVVIDRAGWVGAATELVGAATIGAADVTGITGPAGAAVGPAAFPAPAPSLVMAAHPALTAKVEARAVLKGVSTESPGDGKMKSTDSGMEHCSRGRLATNMSGKLLKTDMSLAPPVTVMGAQFMYISRLPILLNQVHARLYSPLAMPLGMENSKVAAPPPLGSPDRLPVEFEGQPETMLWITFH